MRKQGLAPQIPKSARLLVLGSFPGEESLRQGQYYAHPRNQFWRLMGDVLGEPLAGLRYPDRLRRLASHRVGIWDIITGCEREGSLDSDIRGAAFAQFEWLAGHAPRLATIALNGQKAGTARERIAALGYEVVVLPSSSPAHTLAYERKLDEWRALAAHVSPLRPARR